MFYGEEREFDDKGRLRPDSWELNAEVQQEVSALMEQLTPENFKSDLTAYKLFRKEFLNINGFEVDGNTIDEANFEDLQKMKP
jgi:enoyl-[acyl-carrier protein] reductase/trans-2-enoyl-CoA reductase (NAD+)